MSNRPSNINKELEKINEQYYLTTNAYLKNELSKETDYPEHKISSEMMKNVHKEIGSVPAEDIYNIASEEYKNNPSITKKEMIRNIAKKISKNAKSRPIKKAAREIYKKYKK